MNPELEPALPAAPPSPSPTVSRPACPAVARSPDHATDPTAGLHPPVDADVPAVIRMSDIQPRALDWLWPGWVPLGKVTLLDGDPGQAKSLLLVDLAARVSSGRAMPDGSPPLEADVTFLAPEDGLRDTLRPRLEAAGANLNRIHVIPHLVSQLNSVPELEMELGNEILATNTRLLIVERFLRNGDPDGLHRLAVLAERAHCAVIATRFLNKSAGGKAIYRGAGAMAAIGAARCAMLVAPEPGQPPPHPHPVAPGHSPGGERGEEGEPLHPGNGSMLFSPRPTHEWPAGSSSPRPRFGGEGMGVRGSEPLSLFGPIRVLASTKNNLGPRPSSLRFSLEILKDGVPRIQWLGSTRLTADDLLVLDSVTEGKGAAAQAEKFLKELLKDGPLAAQLCYAEATRRQISEASLRRAKARLGVLHNEPRDLLGLYLPHTWELPPGQDQRE